jgi:hypothetical protein
MAEKRLKKLACVLILAGYFLLLYFNVESRPLAVAGIVIALAGLLIQVFFVVKKSRESG